MSSPASALAAAIAQNEGGALPGTNNPGNLELGDLGLGTLPALGGNQITVFPDEATGQAALDSQAAGMLDGSSSIYSPDMTVAQAASTYTGGNANAGQNWANALGVSPNTTLGQLSSGKGSGSNTPKWLSDLNPLNSSSSLNPFATGANFERIIVVVVGLLLIAAGVFSFRQTQQVISLAGRVGAKGVELLG